MDVINFIKENLQNDIITNRVWINGVINEEFSLAYVCKSESFYRSKVKVTRLSGTDDFIPIIVSEDVLDKYLYIPVTGKKVQIRGEFRSRNRIDKDEKNHLELYLFVYELSEEGDLEESCNLIYLQGVICKPVIYRTTPLGKEISDIMLAVNRANGKTDYIPCIAWGKAAFYMKSAQVGDKLTMMGRIQSRLYEKNGKSHEVYEISITRIKK